MDGAHDIDTCFNVTQWVLKTQFQDLYYQRVMLEGMILKPNMTIAGKKSPRKSSPEEVAEKNRPCPERLRAGRGGPESPSCRAVNRTKTQPCICIS